MPFNRIPKSKPVLLFHDFTRCWPNKIQEVEINCRVSEMYLQRWEEVLKEWMMKGYSPKNVSGMLNWFENGIPDFIKSKKTTPLKNFKEHERGAQSFQGVPVKTYKTGLVE